MVQVRDMWLSVFPRRDGGGRLGHDQSAKPVTPASRIVVVVEKSVGSKPGVLSLERHAGEGESVVVAVEIQLRVTSLSRNPCDISATINALFDTNN